MNQAAIRDNILKKIAKAPKGEFPDKKDLPPLPDESMTKEELKEKFIQSLAEQTGIVHKVKDNEELLSKLADVLKEESVKELAVSEDDIVSGLDIETLKEKYDFNFKRILEFTEREEYKDYIFTKADAGLTGTDFAIAESGSIVLRHDRKQARLISLAPALHIAVVRVKNLVPVYEVAVTEIFKNNSPSQMTIITGPSMTADIQATPFKGMHGPKRLIVFLLG